MLEKCSQNIFFLLVRLSVFNTFAVFYPVRAHRRAAVRRGRCFTFITLSGPTWASQNTLCPCCRLCGRPRRPGRMIWGLWWCTAGRPQYKVIKHKVIIVKSLCHWFDCTDSIGWIQNLIMTTFSSVMLTSVQHLHCYLRKLVSKQELQDVNSENCEMEA